jgi:hypothetical protein
MFSLYQAKTRQSRDTAPRSSGEAWHTAVPDAVEHNTGMKVRHPSNQQAIVTILKAAYRAELLRAERPPDNSVLIVDSNRDYS